jgi:hypothetical protein
MNISDLHRRVLVKRGLPPDLLSDLVAYWDMDGNGVDEVSGITPILETNVTYNNASILGTSAAITGINGILRYADNNIFSFTDGTQDIPFTISCWVYFTEFNSTGNWVINKRNNSSGGDEWQMTYSPGGANRLNFQKYQFNNNTISQRLQSDTFPVSLNQWYHLVVTDNGTANFNGMNMYLNGVNVSNVRENSGGTYTRMNNGTATLGMMNANWAPGTAVRHIGRLDEVAIWKGRELTPEEVLFLYNNGNGITYIDL